MCMFPTNSEYLIDIFDAFFCLLFTGIRHLAHMLTVPPTKVCLLCTTPTGMDLYIQLHACRHLPSAVPWISEDRRLHRSIRDRKVLQVPCTCFSLAPRACCAHPLPWPQPLQQYFFLPPPPPPPPRTWFVHLMNALFWIVTVIVWVDICNPSSLVSMHVFFVAFISIAWNIHKKMNCFICSETVCCHLGMEIQRTLKKWLLFQLHQFHKNSKTTKCHHLQASFYIVNCVTDHLIGIYLVSWNVALNWVVVICARMCFQFLKLL